MFKLTIRVILLLLWLISIVYVYGLGGLAGMYAPQLVERSAKLAAPIGIYLAGSSSARPCPENPSACGFIDTTMKQERDCRIFQSPNPRHAVLFTFGQSNSANAARDSYIAGDQVVNFNYHDGKCYHAADPLLGPDGDRGSVWGAVADKLIASGEYDKVLIVPFGIGGTEIARWAPGGDLHVRVEAAAQQLLSQSIEATHVLWHQGESDSSSLEKRMSSTKFYVDKFAALVTAIREYGIDAPIYPAVATHCGDHENGGNEENEAIRKAQKSLPGLLAGVLPGPDTDSIMGDWYRHDGCHFTHLGIDRHAQLWVEALLSKAPPQRRSSSDIE